MNKQEFAQKIKAKYPAYATMDDVELADKMLAKYPEYGKQLTDSSITQPQAPTKDPYNIEEPGLAGTDLPVSLAEPENWVPAAALAGVGRKIATGLGSKALEKTLKFVPGATEELASKAVTPIARGAAGVFNKLTQAAIPEDVTPAIATAEQKLLEALKGAKVSRKELAKMHHAKRKEQFGMIANMQAESTGEATSKMIRGSLKGKLVDKPPDFDALRPKLEQVDIDELVMKIHHSEKLTPFDKLGADEGLRKILSGEIPQPAEIGKLKSVFGDEVTKEILKHRPWTSKTLDVLSSGANLPRAIMASFDASAPLRQGLILTTSHPRLAGKAFAESWKQTFNPKRYTEWLDSIRGHPLYELMEDSKLYIADPERQAAVMFGKEERFMTETTMAFTKLKEKMPETGKVVERLVNMGLAPVRASERNYTTYLNKLRVDTFSQLADTFIKQGKTPDADPELFKHLANFVNSATGRGSMEGWQRSAQLLNTVFFSPRLIKARLDMTKYFVPGNNIPWEVRKEALKDIGITIGAATTFLGLMKLAGAEVETDPKSSDWMKAKIGNVRIDPWGGFQQYGKLFARSFNWEQLQKGSIDRLFQGKMRTSSGELKKTTALDELTKFARYKVAPTPGYIMELLSGKKVMGGEVDYLPEEKIAPMILQDIKEIAKENPNLLLLTGPLAFFGMNVQSYQPKKKFY